MEKDEMVMNLLKKGKRGLFNIIFSRLGLILIMFLLNILLFLYVILKLYDKFMLPVLGSMAVFVAIMIIYLFNAEYEADVKLTWLVFIILFPVTGSLFLLYTKLDIGHRAVKMWMSQMLKDTDGILRQSEDTMEQVKKESPESAAIAGYIRRTGCYPIYDNTKVSYFPSGEDKFAELVRQLKDAEHFIFLEYFIIEEGKMWGSILKILSEKVKEGVEVRVLYDGTCEFSTLPHDYPKRLRKLGIQCKMFSPLTPFVSTHYNYRDHRKILVIDGHTAFTGGVNLADEYINEKEKYGHWKDTALMLKGEAVKSFTLMFLQMWNDNGKSSEFQKYLSYSAYNRQEESKGYVIPYGDSPLDSDKVGERVYMDILNQAEKYVHIMSPYLILDGEMQAALTFAAERGVEVKLILPGIPDKKIPYALAKTHYKALLKSGVQIYEYTPGFVHAKVFVSDDSRAVVGTINMDYRSFYHHFECAAYLYGKECIYDIEQDFEETIKQCLKVTMDTVKKEKWHVKLTGWLMKSVAPLL